MNDVEFVVLVLPDCVSVNVPVNVVPLALVVPANRSCRFGNTVLPDVHEKAFVSSDTDVGCCSADTDEVLNVTDPKQLPDQVSVPASDVLVCVSDKVVAQGAPVTLTWVPPAHVPVRLGPTVTEAFGGFTVCLPSLTTNDTGKVPGAEYT